MRVLVFVSDDGTEDGTGPLLFLREHGQSILPPHPRALGWRYFATVEERDQLLQPNAAAILKGPTRAKAPYREPLDLTT